MAKRTVLDKLADRPLLDWLILVALAAAWHFLAGGVYPQDAATRPIFYSATSAVAGIVLAAATFVCTFFYQSSKYGASTLRDRQPDELRSAWTGILSSLMMAAVLPALAIPLEAVSAQLAFGVALSCLVVVALRFFRVILWFNLSLRLPDESRPAQPPVQARYSHPAEEPRKA